MPSRLAVGTGLGCVLSPSTDCRSDDDCPRGYRCAPATAQCTARDGGMSDLGTRDGGHRDRWSDGALTDRRTDLGESDRRGDASATDRRLDASAADRWSDTGAADHRGDGALDSAVAERIADAGAVDQRNVPEAGLGFDAICACTINGECADYHARATDHPCLWCDPEVGGRAA